MLTVATTRAEVFLFFYVIYLDGIIYIEKKRLIKQFQILDLYHRVSGWGREMYTIYQ